MAFIQVPLFASNDAADTERINAIISNTNYLNDSKVSMRYNAYGVVQTDQMKIAAGVLDLSNPNSWQRRRWITVSGFFTPGTRPVGAASFSSIAHTRATIVIARRNATSPVLDHTGLSAYVRNVNTSENLDGENYVNWTLIGY